METDDTEVAMPPMFTAVDRCDRCGAQARLRALLNDSILLFCGHHGRINLAALEAAGIAYEPTPWSWEK